MTRDSLPFRPCDAVPPPAAPITKPAAAASADQANGQNFHLHQELFYFPFTYALSLNITNARTHRRRQRLLLEGKEMPNDEKPCHMALLWRDTLFRNVSSFPIEITVTRGWRELLHIWWKRTPNPVFFSASGKEKCRLYRRFEGKLTEDARNDTPHSVCASAPARTVAGEEEVCRVRVGVRERERGREGLERERQGGDPGDRKKREKEGATMSSSSCQPGAHLLPGIILEKEREEMWLSGRAGGAEGCGTERQTDD